MKVAADTDPTLSFVHTRAIMGGSLFEAPGAALESTQMRTYTCQPSLYDA